MTNVSQRGLRRTEQQPLLTHYTCICAPHLPISAAHMALYISVSTSKGQPVHSISKCLVCCVKTLCVKRKTWKSFTVATLKCQKTFYNYHVVECYHVKSGIAGALKTLASHQNPISAVIHSECTRLFPG